jgi:hypothetical protein
MAGKQFGRQQTKEKAMVSCYEYLGCGSKDCIMYGQKDKKHCWEVEGTLCNHYGIQLVRNNNVGMKKDACYRSGCIYYK